MRVWRLTRRPHARTAFSGEGARQFGGRWNSPGVAVVYTSEHLSLALVEYLVGVDPDTMPDDVVYIEADCPDEAIESLDPASIAGDWRNPSRPHRLQEAGDAWARKQSSLALQVPSAVVPQELNVLINPEHPAMDRVRMADPAPFSLDPRLRR